MVKTAGEPSATDSPPVLGTMDTVGRRSALRIGDRP